MFIQAHELAQAPQDKVWDVCIVGAGAAGLSVLEVLAASGLSVLLLESGGLARDAAADALNRGTSTGTDYPFERSRNRGFGGTMAQWAGACIPLDPADFEARPSIPLSGWPIVAEDLAPHYRKAAALFATAPLDAYDATLQASPLHGGDLVAKTVHTATRLDLADALREPVRRSDTVTCVLGATATGLVFGEERGKLAGVELRDAGGGGPHILRARATVLATGGIEAPRLLLHSARQTPGAFAAVRAMLGRCFMDHPMRSVGVLPVGTRRAALLPFTNGARIGGAPVLGTLALSAEVRRRERLTDVHLRAYRFHPLEARPDVSALKRALARGGDGAAGAVLRAHGAGLALRAAHYGAWHAWNKAARAAAFDHVRFIAWLEQEPDPSNRLTLGDKTDRFGVPLPHLALAPSDAAPDVAEERLERSLAAFARAFAAAGFPGARLGRAHWGPIEYYSDHGLHQMGATRMADDPARGVVDADCRVHGTENLYVAGGSVFATGGAANPTLTIVALAQRLAVHLRERVARNGGRVTL